MAKKKSVIEVPVEEKTQYDNFIGKVAEEYKPASLAEFLGEDEEDSVDKEWQKHWIGMPEFKNEENPAYKRLMISFRNEDDFKAFTALMDQTITMKTKSIWYPALDKTQNALLRWIEEDSEE